MITVISLKDPERQKILSEALNRKKMPITNPREMPIAATELTRKRFSPSEEGNSIEDVSKVKETPKSKNRKSHVRETDLSATIGKWLDFKGIYQIRVQSGQVQIEGRWIHCAKKGTPDRILCYKGRFVGLEIKKPGAKPTKDQLAAHDEIRRCGGIVIIASSIEDVEKGLIEI